MNDKQKVVRNVVLMGAIKVAAHVLIRVIAKKVARG